MSATNSSSFLGRPRLPQPATVEEIVAVVRWVGRESGYAIGVHGTLIRDIDLMAMSWGDGPVEPQELAKRIADELGWDLSEKVTDKPRGRKAFVIRSQSREEFYRYIDLSVMDAMGESEKNWVENLDLKKRIEELEGKIVGLLAPPPNPTSN